MYLVRIKDAVQNLRRLWTEAHKEKKKNESDETGCVLRKDSTEGQIVRDPCSSTSNLPNVFGVCRLNRTK